MSDEDYVKDGEYLPAESVLEDEDLSKHVNLSTDAGDVVRTTQSLRLQILKHRLKGRPSDDPKEINVNLQLLRDLDTAALTSRKIDVEERAVNEAERASQQTQALLKALDGRNPFAIDISTGQVRKDLVEREVTASLPEPDYVPGLTDQGTRNLNYADFVDDPDKDPDHGEEDEAEED